MAVSSVRAGGSFSPGSGGDGGAGNPTNDPGGGVQRRRGGLEQPLPKGQNGSFDLSAPSWLSLIPGIEVFVAMSEVLHVQKRNLFGKRNNRRLRGSGQLPAVLYGHGEESVSLTLPADEFHASLRHGARVVDLEGDVQGQALLQDVQWDTFFQHVLHVDLLRVVAGEKVTVSVPVETRGEAPGTHDGGIVELLVHELEVEVTPANVPERLHLNVNHLELDGTLTVADIEDLPAEARVLAEPDTVLVHCVARGEREEEEPALGEVEPEVIGQKAREEEEEGGES